MITTKIIFFIYACSKIPLPSFSFVLVSSPQQLQQQQQQRRQHVILSSPKPSLSSWGGKNRSWKNFKPLNNSNNNNNGNNNNSNENNERKDEDDDKPIDNNNMDSDDDDSGFYASLNARRSELLSKTSAVNERWKAGNCKSSICLALDDWIRRLSIGSWPIGVVGTARGSIVLADLSMDKKNKKNYNNGSESSSNSNSNSNSVEGGNIIAAKVGIHDMDGGDPKALQLMHGNFDGAGVLAVALREDNRVVVSAGREGGAKVFVVSINSSDDDDDDVDKEDMETNALQEQKSSSSSSSNAELLSAGILKNLNGIQVTSLAFHDNGDLWVGCFDNKVRIYNEDGPLPYVSKTPITLPYSFESPVLCLSLCSELSLAAIGTANGFVHFVSTDPTDLELGYFSSWRVFHENSDSSLSTTTTTTTTTTTPTTTGIVRSISFVETSEDSWSVVVGGGNGRIYIRPLSTTMDFTDNNNNNNNDDIFDGKPVEMTPPHNDAIVSIASRTNTNTNSNGNALIVTGARDGTLRIWDCSKQQHPECLYQMVGYKVWLGSVCVDSDGLRLVSDGSDNTLVLHDFSKSDDTV